MDAVAPPYQGLLGRDMSDAQTAAREAALLKTFGFAFGAQLTIVEPQALDAAYSLLKTRRDQIPADLTESVSKIEADLHQFIVGVKAVKDKVKQKDAQLWETLYKEAMQDLREYGARE